MNGLVMTHLKPRTPRNLVLSSGTSKNEFILTWDSTYPSYDLLTDYLKYKVKIQKKGTTWPVKELETYGESNLTILANQLENNRVYIIQVKSGVSPSEYYSYSGPWSDWSHSIEWHNEYEQPSLTLELGVLIFCILILFINLLCYFSVIKIKKVWWDQIPNPAHSRLTAIIIQSQQLSAWRKLPKAKEKRNFPHWKTCLSKLFPCLFSHDSGGKNEPHDFSKGTHLPLRSKLESWPMEACRAVLIPEQISVVQSVELCEAEVESEKGDADDVSFSPSPENSANSFIQNKEALKARFGQTLFFDIIKEETFMSCSNQPSRKYRDSTDATESPPNESKSPSHCWDSPARLGSPIFQNGCLSVPHISERSDTVCQSLCMDAVSSKVRQPPEPHQEQWQLPSAAQTPDSASALGLANASISEVLQVVDDNPAYRSFNSLLAQSLSRTEEELSLPLGSSNCSQEQMALCHGDPDLQHGVSCSEDSQTSSSHDCEPSSLLQSEGESWEEILRQRVLRQEGAVTCPTILTSSGYRCFDNAVKQGNDQNYKAASFNVPGESGYRSFASLLNYPPETSTEESKSGKEKGGYRPLENLASPSQEAEEVTPLPLFTFGLDLGEAIAQKHQHSPVPSSFLKMYGPQETTGEEIAEHALTLGQDGTEKHDDTPEESKVDFSSGIVYSTLTCHLCGHLKRCPSPDGNYKPLGNAQSTKCNCVVEFPETMPHPLTKATSLCPPEIMKSPENSVPMTSSVEFLGESHLEEESSLGICVSLLPQDCEDPFGSTSEKWKGSPHLKASSGGVLSPSQSNMADCEHEGNTYIKVS
ncbi:interleukin-4 receptor subunit alpha isoform X2 [Dromiciops gliroides]|uniref:interleukin-4 receptor subunit alpha isoform X2 n=1 Tax=Dromiciops gliroides TaxID=33562 RepID=UPI001CC65740|nr:interleukin-4 receptor subunit alpha isoform X2 [Dromiciops gliroides]